MWRNVPICDEHWEEEQPGRTPIRVLAPPEPCYRCGALADIYVRREVTE